MFIPVLYMVAIQPNENIIQIDSKVYKTEKGAKRRLEKLKKEFKESSQLFVIYADDFKRA